MQNLFKRVGDSQTAFEHAYASQASFARQDISQRQQILDDVDLRVRSHEEMRTRQMGMTRQELLYQLYSAVEQYSIEQYSLVDASRQRLRDLIDRAARLRESMKQGFAETQDYAIYQKLAMYQRAEALRQRAQQLAIREEQLNRKCNEEFRQMLLQAIAGHESSVTSVDYQFLQMKKDMDVSLEERQRSINRAQKELSRLVKTCGREISATARERRQNENALTRHLYIIIDRIEAIEQTLTSRM